MKQNLTTLFEELNLLYYEYNSKKNTLFLDKNWSEKHIFGEFMKLTNILTRHNIKFFIDKEKNIIISDNYSVLKKMKRYSQTIIENKRNNRMDIYILSPKKVKWAKNLPVFQIHFLKPTIDFTKYDALIFTSKNAIKAIDKIDKSWKKKPAYAIAPQTAKLIKDLNGDLQFVGKTNHGDQFAQEILEKFKNQKLLYLRASKIVSNLVPILNSGGIICDELIVYETVCTQLDTNIKLPKNATIIFSSPSTIKCFLENIEWDESFKAISIGDTTAKFFPSHIIPTIADKTSLESCVQKAIEINTKGYNDA